MAGVGPIGSFETGSLMLVSVLSIVVSARSLSTESSTSMSSLSTGAKGRGSARSSVNGWSVRLESSTTGSIGVAAVGSAYRGSGTESGRIETGFALDSVSTSGRLVSTGISGMA